MFCIRMWRRHLIGRNFFSPALLALPLLLSSCATPQPPQVYHGTDASALVIESLDGRTGRMVHPSGTDPIASDAILTRAGKLPQHHTAVVILENYTEPQIGDEFRSRGTPWFIGLRCLGYQHIVFLQGTGSHDPEGLLIVAQYD
jgi:hypothetical protein